MKAYKKILKQKSKLIEQNNRLVQENKDLRATKTTEIRTGYFEKKIIRHGQKKREKLSRFEKNPAKLSLGWFGNLEFFCYPHTDFDKVFIRDGNKIHGYDKYDLPRMIAIFNKARWVTEHGSSIIKGVLDSESPLARMVQNAYNAGIQQELIHDSKIKKLEFEERLKSLENMKPKFRDKWFEDEPALKREWDKRKKSKKGGGR